MTRIAPLVAPFDSAVSASFAKYLPAGLESLNLFRTQAHNPRVLERMLAGSLLDAGSIDQRTRELVILRTCFRCGSEYEWGVHVALFSKAAALSAPDVAATITPAIDLPEPQAVLLRAVDELHATSTISDELWSALERHYAPAQIIEIIALVGNYHAVSFLTNAARIDLEAFAPRMATA